MKNINTPFLYWQIEQGETTGLLPKGMTLQEIIRKITVPIDKPTEDKADSSISAAYEQLNSQSSNNDSPTAYPPSSCQYYQLVYNTIKKDNANGLGEKHSRIQFSYAANLYSQFLNGTHETDELIRSYNSFQDKNWTLSQSKRLAKTLEQKDTVEGMLRYLATTKFSFPTDPPLIFEGGGEMVNVCLSYLLGFEVITVAVLNKWPNIIS